jgi:hypothetical protein
MLRRQRCMEWLTWRKQRQVIIQRLISLPGQRHLLQWGVCTQELPVLLGMVGWRHLLPCMAVSSCLSACTHSVLTRLGISPDVAGMSLLTCHVGAEVRALCFCGVPWLCM